MRLSTLAILILFAGATFARADAPKVVTSIAPLQGLVSDIMRGVAEPELLLDENISPHNFALRPSQAKAVSDADIVFYIGLDFEPWLAKLLQSGEQGKLHIALGEIPSLNRLDARELDEFSATDDHQHNEGNHIDPHMWLDPDNVLLWLDIITGILSIADPMNEELYHSNLEKTRMAVSNSANFTRYKLQDVKNVNLVVTHDSLQYLEDSFELNVVGTFSASDGQAAGAKSLSTVYSLLEDNACLIIDLSHASYLPDDLPATVLTSTLDPTGLAQLGGEGYYPRLLEHLSNSLVKCKP